MLTSGNVLARVVDELDLANDKEFYDPNPGGFSLSKLLGVRLDDDQLPPRRTPRPPRFGALEPADVSTKADDTSYVAEMSVSWRKAPTRPSRSPTPSSRLFQDEARQGRRRMALAVQRGGARRPPERPQERCRNRRAEGRGLQAAEQSAVDQRPAREQPDDERAQRRTRHRAVARFIDAQAAYDAVLAAGRNATPSDTAAATALSALRDKADTLRQQLDSESMVFGPRHPTILRLQAQYSVANAQVTAGIARVVSGARSTLEQAKAAVTALQAKQKSLTTGVFADNAAQVGLAELQRDADAKTAIYQSFLSRAQQITQSEQIDTTNVRVISTAVPPPDRSWPPRPALMIGVGGVAGFVFGLFLAIVFGVRRDMRQAPRRAADAAIAG